MLHRVVYWAINLMAKLLKGIFSLHTRPDSITKIIIQNYKSNPDFRAPLVEAYALQSIRSENVSLSADEILAVLSLWAARKPLDEVISLVTLHGNSGWKDSLDRPFLEKLSQTTMTWRYKGLEDVADKLLKIGKYIAEMVKDPYHASQYEQEIIRRHKDKDRINLNHIT
jgi:hypothetical protein